MNDILNDTPQTQSEQIDQLVPALLAAKAQFRPVVKNALNPHFKNMYADLETVLSAVEEALGQQQLVLVQPTNLIAGESVLVTTLLHSSGQWLRGYYRLRGVKADPQGDGSALSYARRYAALAILGIAAEDDDGNGASSERQQQAQRQAQGPPAQQNRPEPSGRDWLSELAEAKTGDAVRNIYRECGAFGERTSELETAILSKGQELAKKEQAKSGASQ